MDTIQLNISKQQFFGMLQAMPEQDKLEVFDRLRKSLFVSRFDRLLRSVRTDELSLEDITREVEAVRQEHYEERNAPACGYKRTRMPLKMHPHAFLTPPACVFNAMRVRFQKSKKD